MHVFSALAKGLGAQLPADVCAVRGMIEKEVPLYSGINWDGGVVSYPYVFAGEVAATDGKAKGKGKFFLYPASLRLHSGSFTRWSPDLAKVYGEPMLEIGAEDAKELGIKSKDRVKVKGEGFEGEFLVEIEKKVSKGCIALPEDFVATAGIFCNGKSLRADIVK